MATLYYNGTIITMSNPPVAEAVLTEGERVVAVGPFKRLFDLASGAETVNLEGRTLMPAFVDAHSHLSSYASSFLQVPLDECVSFDEIFERIQGFIADNAVKEGEWVFAKGYDNNALKERRHPTLALVDACAPKNPLILQHASGHVGVFNSLALRLLSVNPDTPSPEGGRIGTENGYLTGYMEENAYFTYMKKAPMAGAKELFAAYMKAQAGYAAHGITTIQEGMMVKEMLPLYRQLLSLNMLYLDTVGYASVEDTDAFIAAFPQSFLRYDRHFKLGGCKIFLDGSPQGRTAWMRKPYLGSNPDYRGYGTMRDEQVLDAVEASARQGMQLLAHCNGDAAARQFLNAVELAERDYDVAALRPVMIHAQLLGRDQLPLALRLGVTPSFFVAHTYHWGDVHLQNFGEERAFAISPTASALSLGLRFTFHQDTPVIAPNMLETLWCAVNRVTKGGVSLGEAERIPVEEALKAVTVNAAWQYFEEDKKGSIEAGKNADFVMLDRNPLSVPLDELRDIRVLKTIKGGKTIFERQID